jgi:hypothetical protein
MLYSGPLPSDAEAASLLVDSPIQPAVSPLTNNEASLIITIQLAIETKISEELSEFGKTTVKPPLPLVGKRDQGAAESTVTRPLAGLVHADSALVKIKPTNSISGFATRPLHAWWMPTGILGSLMTVPPHKVMAIPRTPMLT